MVGTQGPRVWSHLLLQQDHQGGYLEETYTALGSSAGEHGRRPGLARPAKRPRSVGFAIVSRIYRPQLPQKIPVGSMQAYVLWPRRVKRLLFSLEMPKAVFKMLPPRLSNYELITPNSTLPLIPVHFLSAAKYFLCRSLKRRSCVLFSPCLHIRPHRLADILAPALATYTCQATRVPQLWKDAWITLVPKIPRPLEPKNLRPIGLTEAGGRAIARILQGRLRPYVNQYLQSIPQFAYLTQRSTSHAILRVQSHCKRIQEAKSLLT